MATASAIFFTLALPFWPRPAYTYIVEVFPPATAGPEPPSAMASAISGASNSILDSAPPHRTRRHRRRHSHDRTTSTTLFRHRFGELDAVDNVASNCLEVHSGDCKKNGGREWPDRG